MVISYSQTLISAKGEGKRKPHDREVMVRAARARWDKHWAARGGRPTDFKAHRKQMLREAQAKKAAAA